MDLISKDLFPSQGHPSQANGRRARTSLREEPPNSNRNRELVRRGLGSRAFRSLKQLEFFASSARTRAVFSASGFSVIPIPVGGGAARAAGTLIQQGAELRRVVSQFLAARTRSWGVDWKDAGWQEAGFWTGVVLLLGLAWFGT